MKKKMITIVAFAGAVVMAMAGCGTDGEQGGNNGSAAGGPLELYGHTVEFDQSLADRVPADWKGGITLPIQVLRPNAYVDESNEVIGMQPDLLRAFGTKVGIDITFEVAPFDSQVPGVQSGQYAFTTATGDFEQRREVLDMVDYTVAGLGWLVNAGSDITTVDDLCGKHIGVAKGTNQEVRVEDFITECDEKGIPGTTATGFSNTLMTVPLEANRIDATLDSISSVLYFSNSESDKFNMIGEPMLDAPIAFGVVKGETEKVELIRDVMQSLIDDGTYDAVFENWQLDMLKLDKIYVNSEGLTIGG